MNPEDADWDGPFSTLYHEWRGEDGAQDEAIGKQLAATYRDAWASGNPAEHYCVVYWIMSARFQAGSDLLRQGLKSEIDWLAADTAPVALTASQLFHWDLGDDIGDVFFELILKQPHLETFRWPEIRDREDDPRCGPFTQRYLRYTARRRARPKAERELSAMYREAWSDGDWRERAFVLDFVSSPPQPDAANVIVEGLRSDHPMVVEGAMRAADFYIYQRVNLGTDIRGALQRLLGSSARNTMRVKGMLRELDEQALAPSS